MDHVLLRYGIYVNDVNIYNEIWSLKLVMEANKKSIYGFH